ncbi:MAG: RluA family pseudouridine synthase [Deltaproteobacteria bacterium]|nr:RluA family pseudouridine synthase [Deltaproteobacteria bacterium]
MRLSPSSPPLRIDRALVDALGDQGHPCTRAQLARAFGRGDITVGGRPIKPSLRVDRVLDVAVVFPHPEPLRAEPEDIALTIVHEDADLLVVDKPAGMVVHPGPGHAAGTLVNAVLHHLGIGADRLPVLEGNDPTRPGIVHRLDRQTSGVMVVAKTPLAQEGLAAQFRTHTLQRRYLGVVEGQPSWTQRRVETGHARDPHDRRRFAPLETATRRATSDAEVIEPLRGAATVGWTLHTGRTHQIRMHARYLGHPILGDTQYGRTPSEPAVRTAAAALTRHALHAELLGVVHPRSGASVTWRSPLPAELETLIEQLRP